jgi:nitrous oxidase accessory protein NosD
VLPVFLFTLVTSAAELEQALARARAGDEVVVAPGDYAVNLRLSHSGAPGARITVRAAGRAVLSARNPTLRVLDLAGASHWSFEGLAFRGSRHANVRIEGGRDIVLRGCEVFDAGKKGIIANGDDVLIDGCHVHGIAQPLGGEDTQGIVTWGANRLTIMRSRIVTPGDGILIGGAESLSRTSRDVRILGNHIHAEEGWYGRLHVENAIDVKNVSGLLVAGNVIHHYRGREDDDPMGCAMNVVTRDPEVGGVIEDVRVVGNVFADVVRALTVEAADGPGRRLLFAGNVVVSARAAHGVPRKPPAGLYVGRWDGLEVAGNVFVRVEGGPLRAYDPERLSGCRFAGNILVATEPSACPILLPPHREE